MTFKTCVHCEKNDEETRPYGPGGTDVCFTCAMATPERKEQTANAFIALIEAVDATGVTPTIGSSVGPAPMAQTLKQMEEDNS